MVLSPTLVQGYAPVVRRRLNNMVLKHLVTASLAGILVFSSLIPGAAAAPESDGTEICLGMTQEAHAGVHADDLPRALSCASGRITSLDPICDWSEAGTWRCTVHFDVELSIEGVAICAALWTTISPALEACVPAGGITIPYARDIEYDWQPGMVAYAEGKLCLYALDGQNPTCSGYCVYGGEHPACSTFEHERELPGPPSVTPGNIIGQAPKVPIVGKVFGSL